MKTLLVVLGTALVSLLAVNNATAHCDTMNGPVVKDARLALEKGDLTPVLKWVRAEDEKEVRQVFEQVRRVRTGSSEARELADRYFFETVVRIHRASEGMPYTGLKTEDPLPVIKAADAALESGSVDQLSEMLSHGVQGGLQERYEKARETRAHMGHNVEAGREYVKAYVAYTHFAEAIHEAVHGGGEHGDAPTSEAHAH